MPFVFSPIIIVIVLRDQEAITLIAVRENGKKGIGELCSVICVGHGQFCGGVNIVFDCRSHYSTLADGVSQPGS